MTDKKFDMIGVMSNVRTWQNQGWCGIVGRGTLQNGNQDVFVLDKNTLTIFWKNGTMSETSCKRMFRLHEKTNQLLVDETPVTFQIQPRTKPIPTNLGSAGSCGFVMNFTHAMN